MGPSRSPKGGAMDYKLFTSIEVNGSWHITTHIETGSVVQFNVKTGIIDVNGSRMPAARTKMAFAWKSINDFLGEISDFCNEQYYGF